MASVLAAHVVCAVAAATDSSSVESEADMLPPPLLGGAFGFDDREHSPDAIARKVFVSRIPLGTTSLDLAKAFAGCGKVRQCAFTHFDRPKGRSWCSWRWPSIRASLVAVVASAL